MGCGRGTKLHLPNFWEQEGVTRRRTTRVVVVGVKKCRSLSAHPYRNILLACRRGTKLFLPNFWQQEGVTAEHPATRVRKVRRKAGSEYVVQHSGEK